MNSPSPADALDARRRRLDELFADQPYLSATMRAAQMHSRSHDAAPPFAIPVVPGDDVARRVPESRAGGAPAPTLLSRCLDMVPGPTAPTRAPQPAPAPAAPAPVARALAVPDEGALYLGLTVDTRQSPAEVRVVPISGHTAPDVMTPREAAEYLRFGESTVRQWARLGRLPGIRIGGRLRFRRQALLKWLADQE